MTQSSSQTSEVEAIEGGSPTFLAIRNALKLGGSLFFTWSIALAIRLLLPRFLGPERFGELNFADAFTTALFITLNLGSDAYIRKEVAVRPSHASDFFGGMFALRVIAAAALFGVIAVVMDLSHKSADLRSAVFLYAATQFFVTANATLSAMLHAKGRVGAMSVLAVATKVIWAVGVLIAMWTNAGLWAYAVSYLASESVETVVLYALAQKHLGLVFRIGTLATKKMLISSLPYYATLFATTAYGKLDVSLLDFLGTNEEVGWYGAASAVAGLTLLITPLIGWVLTPMYARAASRSSEELFEQIRRTMELILIVAIPASLMLNLGAETWISVIFGARFLPAASALRVLATMFVLTYVAIVYAQALVMQERAWALAKISIAGLFVNVGLNLFLIRRTMAYFGRGGGGTGCALAMLGTEIFVTSIMFWLVGKGAFDRRSVSSIGKSLAAYAVVSFVHAMLAFLGPARLVIDGVLYATVVLWTGAVRPTEMVRVIRDSRRAEAR
jgi:O-antigen/teichoic acid export membrane protein